MIKISVIGPIYDQIYLQEYQVLFGKYKKMSKPNP